MVLNVLLFGLFLRFTRFTFLGIDSLPILVAIVLISEFLLLYVVLGCVTPVYVIVILEIFFRNTSLLIFTLNFIGLVVVRQTCFFRLFNGALNDQCIILEKSFTALRNPPILCYETRFTSNILLLNSNGNKL